VSRLARLLRVARLVSVSPDLRLIIETMLRSIPSMGHVAMLLGLLIYVYAILGYYMFHRQDPVHWGTLGQALLSVFQLLTLEGWVELQEVLIPAYPWVWLYFSSFVIVGVFIVINLFIAVVLNNLETVRSEQQERDLSHGDLVRRVDELRAELESFAATLRRQQEVGGDGRSGMGVKG
jgi:voltage-gated sodium channel